MEPERVSETDEGELMHHSSYIGMGALIAKHCAGEFGVPIVTVLDIGSLDCNGTYRDLIPPHWKYIGADLRAGPNVDICMESEFNIPLDSDSVDLVISGQCLEHCSNPFRLVREAARILRPGGTMILVAPFVFHEHKEPVDCFRFLPDGMRAIFDDAGIETIDAHMDVGQMRPRISNTTEGHVDCWGIGRKPCA
jgi:SAM-dependent methyltransferase